MFLYLLIDGINLFVSKDGRLSKTLALWNAEYLQVLNEMPFTSVAVERIFSVYKAMNRENRQRFEFKNLRKFVISKCILQKVCFIFLTQI